MTKLALTFPDGKAIPEQTNQLQGRGKLPYQPGVTPAEIISDLLPTAFVFAGIILLFMMVFGGFTIFVSVGNPEKIKKGTGMITNALIGFLIIFTAYWIIQIIEFSLGVSLLPL